MKCITSLIIVNISNIKTYPLEYIFKKLTFTHKPNTLWLEFGVASGKIINYISKFTNDYVYEFDSFKGLSEKWRDKFDNIIFCIFFVKLQHKFHSTN